MSRDTNKYTRWRSSDNEDEVDDEEIGENYPNSVIEPLDDHSEEYEQMQEGRRVLAMVTPSKSGEIVLSPAATGRIVCISFLVCTFCILFGAFISYLAVSKCVPPEQICQNKSIPAVPASHVNISSSNCDGRGSNTTLRPDADQPKDLEYIRSVSAYFLSHLTPDLIRRYIENITSVRADHLKYVISSTFNDLGLTVTSKSFPVMMSMPNPSKPNLVEIVMTNGSRIINNATTSLKDLTPFSGFSPNGTVRGAVVYAHFALQEDFDLLQEKGIKVNDTILLVRSGKIHPGIQVRNAERAGAKGVIIYPDPSDHRGNNQQGSVYPDSSALPFDGIIWKNLRYVPGDPSTPDHASQKYTFRIPIQNYSSVPSIVVQPVSSETGKTILSLLGGPAVPEGWKGDLLDSYSFGGSFNDSTIRAIQITTNNFIAEELSTNVHAVLEAKDTSKVIHVGSRYESKGNTLTSTGLGLASLLALADSMKRTFPNGTNRQIVFSVFESLDGDFSGGNEYSQLYTTWLESSGLAYIDIDTVLEGAGFMEANVSPILREIVREASHNVAWPVGEGLNVMQGLLKAIPTYRKLNNYSAADMQTAFEFSLPFECDEAVNYHAIHGIPTIQLKAVSVNKNEMYTLENSQYDTVEALLKLEDSKLKWTHMIASLAGLTTLILSSLVLPPVRFDEVGYDIRKGWNLFLHEHKISFNASGIPFNDLLDEITSEVDELILTLESYDSWYNAGKNKKENVSAAEHFRAIEDRVMQVIHFSRRFLRPRNAPQHTEFGLLLTYGPDPTNPCEGTHFPSIHKVLHNAVIGKTPWSVVEEELSYLYGALSSINTDIIRRDNTSNSN